MGLTVTLIVLGSVVGAALLVLLLFVSRQRTLSRRIGSFGCHLSAGDGWSPGRAQYATGRLLWWRSLSLAPRLALVWVRSELTLEGCEPLGTCDDSGRPLVWVACRHRDEQFELTMSAGAYSGLVSWLESGPRPVGRVV